MSTIAELADATVALADGKAALDAAGAAFQVVLDAVNLATVPDNAVLQAAADIYNVAYEAAKVVAGYDAADAARRAAQTDFDALKTTWEQTLFDLDPLP